MEHNEHQEPQWAQSNLPANRRLNDLTPQHLNLPPTTHIFNTFGFDFKPMADPIKRRDFIKTVSLGTSIAIVNPDQASSLLPVNEKDQVKNNYFTVFFDKKKGTINIFRSNGTQLLTGGTTSVNFKSGKHSLLPGKFKFTTKTSVFRDAAGEGKRLTVICSDQEKQTDLEIQLSLYDKLEAVTFEGM